MVQSDVAPRIKSRGAGIVPAPYEDELLYSILARMRRYMGQLPTANWQLRVFGGRFQAAYDLPTQIELISAGLDAGPRFDASAIIDHLTLFNYFSAFVSPQAAEKARDAMIRGGTPHPILGVNGQGVPKIKSLRFCSECNLDWSRAGEDARWLRTFQLPSTLVCPTHEVVLRDSTVSTGRRGRLEFVAASPESCPVDAAYVVDNVSSTMMERLKSLAEIGSAALRASGGQRPASEWQVYYRRWLDRLQLGPKGSKYSEVLLGELENHWGDCLLLWNGAAKIAHRSTNLPWPVKMVQNCNQAFPPLYHFLLRLCLWDGVMDGGRAPPRQRPDPFHAFGEPPWPCLNPVAEHKGSFCVTKIKRGSRAKGRLTARFECECGYEYARSAFEDGRLSRPKAVTWGHVVEGFVQAAAASGSSACSVGTRLGVSAESAFMIAQRMGLDPECTFGWRPPKTKKEVSVLPRKSRKQQPKGVPGRRFLDWNAIDEEYADRLPVIVQEIIQADPPVRVTAALLAKHCGKNVSWIVQCLDRMPKTAPIWNRAVETTEAWQARRRDYNVRRLLGAADTMEGKERLRLLNYPGVREMVRSLQSGVSTVVDVRSEISITPLGAGLKLAG